MEAIYKGMLDGIDTIHQSIQNSFYILQKHFYIPTMNNESAGSLKMN